MSAPENPRNHNWKICFHKILVQSVQLKKTESKPGLDRTMSVPLPRLLATNPTGNTGYPAPQIIYIFNLNNGTNYKQSVILKFSYIAYYS